MKKQIYFSCLPLIQSQSLHPWNIGVLPSSAFSGSTNNSVGWVTVMWSTRLWLVGILTLVHRLTCKSSCKCFAALYLSSAHARMLGMWSILHRDKKSHTWVIPNHTFLSKTEWNGMPFFWQVISCFLWSFSISFSPNWASAWPHGEEHCTKHSSGHENSSTNLAFLHGSCEMLKFHHLPDLPDVRYHGQVTGCEKNGWLKKQLDPMTGALKPWTGPGPTLKVSLRNLKQRCPVSSAEMLVPFGSWISDQPRTWIIDYVTIINPQRNVERWICSMPTCLWIKDFDGRHRAPGSWRWTVKRWFLFHVSFSKHIWLKHMLHESHRLRF